MQHGQALRVGLWVLAAWTLIAAGSQPRETRKGVLAQWEHPSQGLDQGDPCWLGSQGRRPRASPQGHHFGVYPSSPRDSLRPYAGRVQAALPAGDQPDSQAPGVKAETSWLQDPPMGPAGDPMLFGGGLSKYSEAPQGPSTADTLIPTPVPREPVLDAQKKGWPKSRPQRPERRARGTPHRLRRELQDASWEAEPALPHGGLPVLYFSGRPERLRLRAKALAVIPREEFTVEVWVRPDGGQSNPAIIAGVFDHCSHMENDKGWALGIRPAAEEGKQDARFFFSLRTDHVPAATVLLSPRRYQAGRWTHLAATYDGQRMALYVDGTRVASSLYQSGPLHSPFMATCRALLLGGDSSKGGHRFRGHVGTLAFWSTALSQKLLRASSQRPSGEEDLASLVLTGSFEPLAEQWVPFGEDTTPRLEILQGPMQPEVVSPLHAPRCGRTACDNVDLIGQYNARAALRSEKVVRYRVINLCDDQGEQPTVSEAQITAQHQALVAAFSRYNITWELHELRVRNSTLRRRTVLVHCEPRLVGNGHCDFECKHPATGYDGGDCPVPGRCEPWKLQDGVCQPECNNIFNDFDDGDCCQPDAADVHKTCFDPDSPHRAYMSVKELKELLQPNSTHFLNIFFASWAQKGLAGSATWPWEKDALTHQGGVVLNPVYYGMPGHTNTMIHELGHILGLYHVFKGVSERDSCADPCRETVASMDTGDLCADTAPTPKSKLCGIPRPVNDSCGFTEFPGAPFNNYMSYTDDDCTDSFTPNQVARMHCYLDLVYQQWVHSRKPTPIPMPPVVIGQTPSSLTVHWLPPIGGGIYDRVQGAVCNACSEDGTFRQYAYKASSPRVCDASGYWTPEEAVGSPDVDLPCLPNLHAWSPELHLYQVNVTVPCPAEGCSLELRFLHAVEADALTVWLTYLSRSDGSPALLDAEVLLQDGTSVHLGPLDTACDTPLTVRLQVDRKVSGVRLYTADDGVEIDAAQLTSQPRSPLCSHCAPVTYRLLREPPFASGLPVEVTHPQRQFTDLEVQPGQMYQYQVQAAANGELGEPSPPLSHIHGAAFCGDGKVTRSLGEECDDGNLLSGDGCSRACELEEGFHCSGDPSLCYVHEGDGLCEPFERDTSFLDCGLRSPDGYLDQWAIQAESSHEGLDCPASLVTGEPYSLSCRPYHADLPKGSPPIGWFPCAPGGNASQDGGSRPQGSLDGQQDTQLKVSFSRPGLATTVFIFLTSVGVGAGNHQQPAVTVSLTNRNGHSLLLGTHDLSCQHNPLVINVTRHPAQSLCTSSVLLTLSSQLVGISAVALRTFSPVESSAARSCSPERGEQNIQEQSCVPLLLDHAEAVNCTSEGPGHMTCAITCQKGFALRGNNGHYLKPIQRDVVLTCSSGHWDRAVHCTALDCGLPDPSLVTHATFSCAEGTGFQKRCLIACVPPAKLQGLDPWLTCLEDGLWSLPEAYCKVACDAPPTLPHASLLLPRCLQGPQDVGTVCRYECQPGYYVPGGVPTTARSTVLKLQCLESGSWEKGSCIPVVCEPPSPILEGMYKCTNGFKLGSQCIVTCPDEGARPPILCTKEGNWSKEFKLCENLQGHCPPPPQQLNEVEYECGQGYGIGAECSPSCAVVPNDPVILPSNVTVDTLEHWMEPVLIRSIVCTGLRRWFPDPSAVQCIPSCEPFQADGWCDTVNNRAYCDYDGGDCCPSTLSSKMVTPFAASCDTDECACRDPKAEENQ